MADFVLNRASRIKMSEDTRSFAAKVKFKSATPVCGWIVCWESEVDLKRARGCAVGAGVICLRENLF